MPTLRLEFLSLTNCNADLEVKFDSTEGGSAFLGYCEI
jgi:hypothetical protein